jgi:1-acyl-sn-glycerol-3-phosphate acyltransferase
MDSARQVPSSEEPEAKVGRGSDGEAPVRVDLTATYRACSFGARWFCRIYHRARVEGLEHVPARGRVLLASNHTSWLDILLLGGLVPRHVAFVARDTLANWRWLGWTMEQCRAILVRRGAGDRGALRAMVAHLEAEDCVAIFPEGTRSKDGRLLEIKGGALMAARLGRAPIVPVGIEGAHRAWGRGMLLPVPRRIVMRFGAPIDPLDPRAVERLAEAIRTLSGEARGAGR